MSFSKQLLGLISVILAFFTVQSELIYVNELFRHGARGTIVSNYYDSELQQNTKEELSATGMRQHYNLGQQLRKEYIDELQFLDEEINWNQIYVTCTDFNRTLQSAYSHLYGLYPPGTGSEMNELVDGESMLPPFKGAQQPKGLKGRDALPNKFQPIPVHVNTTVLAWPPGVCPNFKKIKEDYYMVDQKVVYDQIQGNYSETFSSLKTLIDYDGEINFNNSEDVWDILIADLNNARPLPVGMTANIWQNLTELDSFYWFFQENGSDLAVKIQNTPLFEAWRHNFEMAKEGKTNGLKWSMYSAHDNNVAGAMVGLNLTSWECLMDKWWNGVEDNSVNCNQRPYFAASLILELHNNDGKYQIAVRYNGQYQKMQKLCGSSSEKFCDYDVFVQFLSNSILSPEEMDTYCNSEDYQFHLNQRKEQQEESVFAQYLRDNSAENKFIFFLQVISIGLLAFVVYFTIKYKSAKSKYFYLNGSANNEPSQNLTDERTQFEVENI